MKAGDSRAELAAPAYTHHWSYIVNRKSKIIHMALRERSGAVLSDERCNLDTLRADHREDWHAYHDDGVPLAVTSLLDHGFRRCGRCWCEDPA